MSAGDVARLMREHADDLVRRCRFHQRAGIDEDAAAVDHEGVEARLVDDDDLHVLLGEAGRAQDRLRCSRAAAARSPRRGWSAAAGFPAPAPGTGASDSAAAVTSAVARRSAATSENRRGISDAEIMTIFLKPLIAHGSNDRAQAATRKRAATAPYIAGFGSRANTLKALNRLATKPWNTATRRRRASLPLQAHSALF